jgi:sulfotransferase
LAGVPRSASTLLCNVLNQNPKFYATDTSFIPELLGGITQKISNSPEVQGMLNVDAEDTQDRLRCMLQGMIESWYSGVDKTIFDKSRGWPFHALLMAQLYPECKYVVTVRDLRGVFSSMEKQHRATPMFDLATTPTEKTMYSRAELMMSDDGMIGGAAIGLQDLMSRCPDNVFVVKYERFSKDPRSVMAEMYDFLQLPKHRHNFKNVKNVSQEPDHIYLNKFPHEGCGEILPCEDAPWDGLINPELADLIFDRYPRYNELFGYTK